MLTCEVCETWYWVGECSCSFLVNYFILVFISFFGPKQIVVRYESKFLSPLLCSFFPSLPSLSSFWCLLPQVCVLDPKAPGPSSERPHGQCLPQRGSPSSTWNSGTSSSSLPTAAPSWEPGERARGKDVALRRLGCDRTASSCNSN